MEQSIKFIRIPLILTGLDIFSENNKTQSKIMRIITYLSMIFMVICFCYTFATSKEVNFSDLIFDLTAVKAFILVSIQLTYFWHYRAKIIEVFDDIKGLHRPRDEEWVERLSQPVFDKCSKFSHKFSK